MEHGTETWIRKGARLAARGVGLVALMPLFYNGDTATDQRTIWQGVSLDAPDSKRLAQPATGTLEIATWNVKGGSLDRDGVVATAAALEVDLLGLTESGRRLTSDITAATECERGEPAYAQSEYGANALVSCFPIVHSETVPLPGQPGLEPRSALMAHVQTEHGVQTVFVAHLTQSAWRTPNTALRWEQTVALAEAATAYAHPIIMGDLNFIPDSEPFRFLEQTYDDALHEMGLSGLPTFDGFLRDRHLDYLMISDRLAYETVGAGRIAIDNSVSDHDVIAAVLRWSNS